MNYTEEEKEYFNNKLSQGVFVDLAFCKSNPTIEWRQTHGGMILKDKNIPFISLIISAVYYRKKYYTSQKIAYFDDYTFSQV